MKDEEWLKRMKERLEDSAEPAPLYGWERLEKELAASSASITPRRIPLYRHWRVAAAAALLVAVSTVGMWFLNAPVPVDVRQPVVVEAVPQETAESEVLEQLSGEVPVASPGRQTVAAVQNVVQPSAADESTACLGRTEEAVRETAGNQEIPVAQQPVTDEASLDETPEVERQSRRERYRPSGSDKYHLPAKNRNRAGHGRWSVALALGNTGGFVSQSVDNYSLLQHSAVMSANGKLDLSATSNGLLTIPAGQEVVFRDGIPYLSNRSRVIESIEHKQPISVGMSVRKVLPKGFSIETGLMYTFLSSDVVFSGSSEKQEQKLHYLGIPVRANWSFLQKDRFELYVSGGGALEKCVHGKIGSENQTVKPVQFSVMGAVGAQVNLTRRLGIYVEPGVSYYFDDGSSVETIRKETPCNFTLQGGIRLTY